MSKLPEEAFAKLTELAEEDQDSIASWLLDELKSERRWDELLTESPDALKRLADGALAEHRQGRTQEFDPDDL